MGKAIINYDAATTNELLDYVKEIKEGGGINLDAPKDGNLYGQQDGEWKQAQEKLVDGESIKTLNGVPVLGSGNIDVAPTKEITVTSLSMEKIPVNRQKELMVRMVQTEYH